MGGVFWQVSNGVAIDGRGKLRKTEGNRGKQRETEKNRYPMVVLVGMAC